MDYIMDCQYKYIGLVSIQVDIDELPVKWVLSL
jgi:hypothetical protein